MASSSWPNPAGSRVVTDVQFEQIMSGVGGDGIIGSPSQTPVVYADSTGRQVKIRANKLGVVRGHGWSSGATDYPLAIAANATGNPRIDLVVLRLTRSTWAVDTVVKTGVAASSPAIPALAQDPDALGAGANTWEIPLATVTAAAGFTTSNAGDVAARTAYLGYPADLAFPDLTTLNLWVSPIPGMTAKIADVQYVYTAAAGWRRADWYDAWGLVGGQPYTSTGAALAIGIPANTLFSVNMNSGLISYTAGRMYKVEVKTKFVQNSVAANVVIGAYDGSLAGNVRASQTYSAQTVGYGYETSVSGTWAETLGTARTLLAGAKTTGGTLDVYRGTSAEQVGVYVYDIGPSTGLLAAI